MHSYIGRKIKAFTRCILYYGNVHPDSGKIFVDILVTKKNGLNMIK